jgi:4-hydroxy-3-methylbut-2-en-1-yl diphosphate synthase IspG/GcpE
MLPRRKTRQIVVGDDRVGRMFIGGDAPVSVQTMTAGYTHDIDACVAEIERYRLAGADVVRVAVPERKDTDALKEIMNQVRVPIVADVHFHYQRALEAVEAGVHKIRLNPGNISDRDQVNKVIDACKERDIPIRVGVNEGSIIERKDKQKRMEELGKYFAGHRSGHLLALMIAKLEEYMDIFEARSFHNVVISAKSDGPGTRDRHLHRDQPALRLPASPWRDPCRPQEHGRHSQRGRAEHAACQRHRRHAAHQLCQRPHRRSEGRTGDPVLPAGSASARASS